MEHDMDINKGLEIYGLSKDRLLLVKKLCEIGIEVENKYFFAFKKDHISFQCTKFNNRILNCVCINPKMKKLKISFHLSPYGDYDNIVQDMVDKYKLTPYQKMSGFIESGAECNGWYAFHIKDGSLYDGEQALFDLFKEAYQYNKLKK